MSGDGHSTATTQPAAGLLERQALLVSCLAKLFQYAGEQGYRLTLGEGYVDPRRRSRQGVSFDDGVHMRDSLHYCRLAQDLNLFVREGNRWTWVTASEHPAWHNLGSYWLSLDSLCRWGGTFANADANHVSIADGGRA